MSSRSNEEAVSRTTTFKWCAQAIDYRVELLSDRSFVARELCVEIEITDLERSRETALNRK
jgi:crotonobetainyl-CoA:carnitine CoA-transferase CaiB-like acyl-CoA transferase